MDDLRAKGLWANFVEAVCVGLRDTIFKPLLGDQTDRYMPVLWTLFWFILVCNLLGLVPLLDVTAAFGKLLGFEGFHGIGGTATQSIWVTGALALVAGLFWNAQGMVKDFDGYFAHLTGGAPVYMWPIIIPVELLGLVIKPFALALRLFANMTGGHVLLAALFGFVYSLIAALGTFVGGGLALIPLIGAVAIYLLEVLVAFLQAFIFAFLTGLFLSQLVVHHGDHEHDDEHGHGHDQRAGGGPRRPRACPPTARSPASPSDGRSGPPITHPHRRSRTAVEPLAPGCLPAVPTGPRVTAARPSQPRPRHRRDQEILA